MSRFRMHSIIMTTAFRDGMRNLTAVLWTGVFLIFVLFIYTNLWGAIAAEHTWAISPAALVWYLAITELPILAPGRIPREIEKDITAGTVSLLLVRPTGYFRQRFAELIGQTAVRFAMLAIISLSAAAAMTGGLPAPWYAIVAAVALAFLSAAAATAQLLTIGALALWLDTSNPLQWLWQKLMWVLGGMTLPLHLYPEPLRSVAIASPFGAMLYGPASILFEPTAARVATVAAQLLLWTMFSFGVLTLVTLRGVRYATQTGKG